MSLRQRILEKYNEIVEKVSNINKKTNSELIIRTCY